MYEAPTSEKKEGFFARLFQRAGHQSQRFMNLRHDSGSHDYQNYGATEAQLCGIPINCLKIIVVIVVAIVIFKAIFWW